MRMTSDLPGQKNAPAEVRIVYFEVCTSLGDMRGVLELRLCTHDIKYVEEDACFCAAVGCVCCVGGRLLFCVCVCVCVRARARKSC